MDLEGSLSVFDPALVLQFLQQAQSTGELKLYHGKSIASVLLEKGELVFACANDQPGALGERLVHEQRITPAEHNNALRDMRKTRTRLGSILIKEKLVQPEEVEEKVRDQAESVVRRIVRWNDGTFSFTGNERAAAENIRIDRSLHKLLLEAMEAWDQCCREPV